MTLLLGKGKPPSVGTTWDRASYPYGVLSNNDRTMTFPNNSEPHLGTVSGWKLIYSTTSQHSGKWYFEVQSQTLNYALIGIGHWGLADYSGWEWGAGGGLQVGGAGIWFWWAGWPLGGLGFLTFPFAAGDWIGVAVDLDSSPGSILVWARNCTQLSGWTAGGADPGSTSGTLTGDPANIIAAIGVSANIPIFIIGNGYHLTSERTVLTINTAAPGVGVPPNGFSWWN